MEKESTPRKVAMGQNPIPVNIQILNKIGSKMGSAPTPQWDPIGFDPQPSGYVELSLSLSGLPAAASGSSHPLCRGRIRPPVWAVQNGGLGHPKPQFL